MANNQQIAGSANIISGVPERVGMPVEAFKEVGAILTQRYYQNKQAHDSITTSLKNMQTIDDEVDKPMLAAKSKVVDDSFKRVVETDNYHNATSTVMDVSKFLSTDEGIKTLSYNVKNFSEKFAKMEEGFKDNPEWRKHIDTFKAMTKDAYKKQGGSVDANGKGLIANVFTPVTNMDTSDEVKAVNDAMKDLKAIRTVSFGNTQYVDKATLDTITNPILRQAVSKLSEDKTTRETITIERLEKAAMDVLAADSDFNTKKQEIIQAEHYKEYKTFDVTKEHLTKILDNTSKGELDEFYLKISPTYKKAFSDLQIKYTTAVNNKDEKAIKESELQYKDLNNKKDIFIKEGKDFYTNKLPKEDIAKHYYSLQSEDITDKILATSHRHKVNNLVDLSRHYYETNLSAVLKDSFDKSEATRAFNNAVSTGVVGDITEIYNPNSDVMLNVAAKEEALRVIKNKKGATQEEILAAQNAYDYANSQIAAANGALLNTFEGMSSDQKKQVFRDAWSIFDDDSRNAFMNTKSIALWKKDRDKINNTGLSALQPEDLLKLSNDQILQKIGWNNLKDENGKQVNINSTITERSNILNNLRQRLVKSISKSNDGRIMVTDYEIRNSGKTTPQMGMVKDAVISSMLSHNEDGVSGQLRDMRTGKPLEGLNEIGYSKIDKPTLDDINNNGGIDVTRIKSSRFPGQDVYKVTVPVKVEKDGVMKPTGEIREYLVGWQGNQSLSKEADVADLKNFGNLIRGGKATHDVINTAFMLTGRLANTVSLANGKNVMQNINEIKSRISANPTQTYSHKMDLVQGVGNQRSMIEAVYNAKGIEVYYHATNNPRDRKLVASNFKDPEDIANVIGLIEAYNNGLDNDTYTKLMTIIDNK